MTPTTHEVLRDHADAKPKRTSLFSVQRAYTESMARGALTALLVVSIAFVLSLAWTYRVYRASLVRQPVFVAVDKSGAFHQIDPDALKFRPTDQWLRVQLADVVSSFLTRDPVDIFGRYNHARSFLDSRLAETAKTKDAPEFAAMKEGRGEEVRVQVTQVSLRNTRRGCVDGENQSACEASLSVEKTVFGISHAEPRTIEETVELVFVIKREITDSMVSAGNPVGLVVTDLHEYSALGVK